MKYILWRLISSMKGSIQAYINWKVVYQYEKSLIFFNIWRIIVNNKENILDIKQYLAILEICKILIFKYFIDWEIIQKNNHYYTLK
jgi:hypothetical protein